ncbi:MAG: hypothetical protein ACRERE_41215 [Candidatus Entotheonellia bacterium]
MLDGHGFPQGGGEARCYLSCTVVTPIHAPGTLLTVQAEGLSTGLIHRALIHHLAIVHAQVTYFERLSAWHRAHMEVLDPVQICECEGKPPTLRGADELLDVNRMNRLIACLIATTVAQWLPASGKTGQEYLGHVFLSAVVYMER